MANEKVIRDPIHGNIQVTDAELELIDSASMQRLRRIKQNGLCYLVYPAMTSTRFEHSLGVMHLAGVMGEHLQLPAEEKQALRVAGLLHDIGHCAFSHTSDKLLARMGYSHEKNSVKIIKESAVTDILCKHGVSPKKICDYIRGRGELSKIICSEIDVDKMDYLIRDAYYAGVAYGVIDLERIVESMRTFRRGLVVSADGLEAVESLLISRNLMYQTVYRHHTKRIIECMIEHALDALYDDGAITLEEFLWMDDVDVTARMRSSDGYPRDISRRVDERLLFKAVARYGIKELGAKRVRELRKGAKGVEARISKKAGVPEGYVFVDAPETRLSEYKVNVESDGGLYSVDRVSALAKSLERSEKDKLTVGVYAAPEHARKLRGFDFEKYLK